MLQEKIRIGIKYAGVNLLVGFISITAQIIFEHFNLIDEIKPIISEEDLRSWNAILSVLIVIVVFAPMTEEALFRLLPISAVFLICGKKNKFILWPVIILSSIVFGRIHGSWHNVFIQGLGGIVLSVAFLKGGYVSSVIAHAVFNFVILVIIVIGILFF